MTNATFDLPSARRISTATQWVERQVIDSAARQTPRRGYGHTQAVLAFAESTINHGDSGTVFIANGTPTNESANTQNTVTAYNTLFTPIWTNSAMLLQAPWVESSAPTDGPNWHIVQSYAARRLHGTVPSSGATGPTFVWITNVHGMDGHYDDGTASVYVLDGYRLPGSAEVICHWNDEDEQWESVGCCKA